MKIESLIKRKNGSKIEIGETVYHFAPDANGNHVAEVTDKAHIERFLSITEGYIEFGKAKPKSNNSKPPQIPQTPIQDALQGLDWKPESVEYAEGKTITTAELVNQAFSVSGLTVEAWNALTKEQVEAKLADEVELLADNTPPTPAIPDAGDDEAALRAEGKALKIPSYHLIGLDKLKALIAEKKSGS